MSHDPLRIALPVVLGLTLVGSVVSSVRAGSDPQTRMTMPDTSLLPISPGLPPLDPDAPQAEPGLTQQADPAIVPQPRSEDSSGSGPKPLPKPDDGKTAEAKPPSQREILDRLFDRLSKATDADEASGIAEVIQHMWMHSGSDTADLLMARAVEAMGSDHRDVARSLLDKLVVIDPGWAEAWNKRATLRFLDNDDAGSMEDISHTLSIEPRHFGALSGLGFILKRNGLDKGALTALRKAQQIYPENQDIKKAVDDLVPEVEGRDL